MKLFSIIWDYRIFVYYNKTPIKNNIRGTKKNYYGSGVINE